MRARYRESLQEPKLVTGGELSEYTFDGFKFFSLQIARNSRLRLVIQCPNTILLQKNHNSGGESYLRFIREGLIPHLEKT